MKHILINQIVDISANYENGNFPASNLLDMRPKRIWSAGGIRVNATIALEVSGNISDIAIFNTNAKTATFAASDPCEIEWAETDAWAETDTWANSGIGTITGTVTQVSNSDALWISLSTPITVPCVMSINLTSTGSEVLYAGAIVAGMAEDYGGANFRYGAGEQLVDYSIVSQNSAGSRYYKKRDIVRQVQLTALMLRTESTKLLDTVRNYGAVPSAWKLYQDDAATDDIMLAYPTVSRSIDHRLHDNITLTLNEVA